MTESAWLGVIVLAWIGWFVVAFGDELADTWIGKTWEWLKAVLIPRRWRRGR